MRAIALTILLSGLLLVPACATTSPKPEAAPPAEKKAAPPATAEEDQPDPGVTTVSGNPAPEPSAAAKGGCPVAAETIEEFLARNKGKDGGTPETALTAHSIKEEYRYMNWVKCGQKGQWQLVQQSLLQTDGGPVDAMEMKCSDGGEQRTFYFNISPFFGKFECYDFGKKE
jgi:hypothetical protein